MPWSTELSTYIVTIYWCENIHVYLVKCALYQGLKKANPHKFHTTNPTLWKTHPHIS